MTQSYQVTPIGWVQNARRTAEDDGWSAVPSTITLDPAQFGAEALAGLDAFSHAEVLFLFHAADTVHTGARHPRGNTDWPRVGIFAQRGKDRPNRLGATICEIRAVSGRVVEVAGLDAIDGTPVLDIKPVMSGFERRGALREPPWAREIMAAYWHPPGAGSA
ncbi:MAG: SAM-dependent methyltransferase [Pseudomonadota bacterium]